MKRRLLLTLFLTIIPYCTFAQLSTCAYIDGYWGKWKPQYFKHSGEVIYDAIGSNSGFTVFSKFNHPSNYCFRFQISSYTPPSKDMIKYHYKNNIPFEYNGYVEYFVSDYHPTIKSALKAVEFVSVSSGDYNSSKRTAKAIIKILPYKKHPKCYNIFFEDVGIGIDLGSWEFNN